MNRTNQLGTALLSLALLFILPMSTSLAQRHRVVVSTDIGGTDPDDFQSMVHLLLCADAFDLEALISSPFMEGEGTTRDILRVIDLYEQDYAKLKTSSDRYPTPDALRGITHQGALKNPGGAGFAAATPGSKAIIACARRDNPRPLYVLVWGSLSDVAQALHDAPDIEPKIRVYFIGGPNKMWNPDSYAYIEQHHPKIHFIESNFTYLGQFVGGHQTGEWSNTAFVTAHIAGHGALGAFFASLRKGELKMGDTPSVGWLLFGSPEDPRQPGWGGQFVRIWDGRKQTFDRLTTEADTVEACGIVEFALPAPPGLERENQVTVLFDNRVPIGVENDGGVLRFRFSPKGVKVWPYTIRSDFAPLDKTAGALTATAPPLERTRRPAALHPNWWIDDPDPTAAEGKVPGANSVSRWREDFLRDFAARMKRVDSNPAQR